MNNRKKIIKETVKKHIPQRHLCLGLRDGRVDLLRLPAAGTDTGDDAVYRGSKRLHHTGGGGALSHQSARPERGGVGHWLSRNKSLILSDFKQRS